MITGQARRNRQQRSCPHTALVLNIYLVHLANELIHELLPVAVVAALNEVDALAAEATERAVQLERPQEVVGLLEVGAASVDLVDQILNADDALEWVGGTVGVGKSFQTTNRTFNSGA
jgi:hypothetical protein